MPQPNEEPAIARVREAAARQGVTLDIVVMDASTHTAADAAAAVGAELGQIVKSLVFLAPDADGTRLVPLICLVSGTNRVDVARLATAREPRNETLTYPGGLRARWRWGGSGEGAAVFALSEAGGSLHENGATVATDYEALCRAELRLEGPRGAWTARFASTIYDDP